MKKLQQRKNKENKYETFKYRKETEKLNDLDALLNTSSRDKDDDSFARI